MLSYDSHALSFPAQLCLLHSFKYHEMYIGLIYRLLMENNKPKYPQGLIIQKKKKSIILSFTLNYKEDFCKFGLINLG